MDVRILHETWYIVGIVESPIIIRILIIFFLRKKQERHNIFKHLMVSCQLDLECRVQRRAVTRMIGRDERWMAFHYIAKTTFGQPVNQ